MENNNRVDKLIGVGAGYAVYKYTPRVVYSVNNLLTGKLSGTNLPEEERMALKQIGNDLFEQRFKSMGFTLVDVAKPENMNYGRDRLQRYNKAFDDSIAQSKNFIQRAYRKYWKNFYMRELEGLNYATEKGLNAYFDRGTKSFVVNMDKKAVSLFHEMGHALNNNGGVILKTLQKAHPLAKTIPAATLLIALLNKRPENSPKADTTTLKGKVQYVADKIKDNAALITGLSMAPALLEEGIASLRGQGIAKQLVKDGTLSKELFKKIDKLDYPLIVKPATLGSSIGIKTVHRKI